MIFSVQDVFGSSFQYIYMYVVWIQNVNTTFPNFAK